MLRRIADLLDSTPQFAPVLRWRERVALVQEAIAEQLPPEVAKNIRVAGQEGGLLTLTCRNAGAAARIRQITPRLIAALQKKGFSISEIQLRVDAGVKSVQQYPERRLSQHAKEALAELQKKLPDGALKAAISKLRNTSR